MNLEKPLSAKDPVNKVGYKAFVDLVNSGQMSCSWIEYRKVFYHYTEVKSKSPSKEKALEQTADDMRISRTHVYNIVAKFE